MFKFFYALCALIFLTNANAGDQTIEADKVQLRADKAKMESDKAAAKAAKKSANSGAAPTAALANLFHGVSSLSTEVHSFIQL